MKKRFGKDIIVHWKDTKRWCGMPITFTHYYIIEKPNKWIKLFYETGILHTDIHEVHLYKIDDLSVYESVADKMYGVGNIQVYFSDPSHNNLVLARIKNVYEVYDVLTTLIEKDKKLRNVTFSKIQKD